MGHLGVPGNLHVMKLGKHKRSSQKKHQNERGKPPSRAKQGKRRKEARKHISLNQEESRTMRKDGENPKQRSESHGNKKTKAGGKDNNTKQKQKQCERLRPKGVDGRQKKDSNQAPLGVLQKNSKNKEKGHGKEQRNSKDKKTERKRRKRKKEVINKRNIIRTNTVDVVIIVGHIRIHPLGKNREVGEMRGKDNGENAKDKKRLRNIHIQTLERV